MIDTPWVKRVVRSLDEYQALLRDIRDDAVKAYKAAFSGVPPLKIRIKVESEPCVGSVAFPAVAFGRLSEYDESEDELWISVVFFDHKDAADLGVQVTPAVRRTMPFLGQEVDADTLSLMAETAGVSVGELITEIIDRKRVRPK